MTTITDDPILLAAIRQERRERIATAVLAGKLSNPSTVGTPDVLAPVVAKYAVTFADALIAELDKEPTR